MHRILVGIAATSALVVGCSEQTVSGRRDAGAARAEIRNSANGSKVRLDPARLRALRSAVPGNADLRIRRATNGALRSIDVPRGTIPVPGDERNPEARARRFMAAWGDLFGLQEPAREIRHVRTGHLRHRKDEEVLSTTVVFEQVTPNGDPVFGSHVVVGLSPGGGVRTARAAVVHDPPGTEASLSSKAAIHAAKEQLANRRVGVAASPVLGLYSPELVDGPPSAPTRLAWRIEFSGEFEWEVYVDASEGQVIEARNVTQMFGGPYREITESQCEGEDGGTIPCGDRPDYITSVDDYRSSGCFWAGKSEENVQSHELVYRTDADGDGGPPEPTSWPGNTEVVNESIKRFHGYLDNHDRTSWDGDGGWYVAMVDRWEGTAAAATATDMPDAGARPGKTAEASFGTQVACLDIVAHEYMHHAEEEMGQPGSGLGEHIALVFPQFTEEEMVDGGTDWTASRTPGTLNGSCQYGAFMGNMEQLEASETCALCPAANHMSNDGRWNPCTGEQGTDSTDVVILNKAAWLLGQDDDPSASYAGISVNSIGAKATGDIWYGALSCGSLTGADRRDFRAAIIDTAEQMDSSLDAAYGDADYDFATEDALDAIGIWREGTTTFLDQGQCKGLDAKKRVAFLDFDGDHLAFFRDDTSGKIQVRQCSDGCCTNGFPQVPDQPTSLVDPTASTMVIDGADARLYLFYVPRADDGSTGGEIHYHVYDASAGAWNTGGPFAFGYSTDAPVASTMTPYGFGLTWKSADGTQIYGASTSTHDEIGSESFSVNPVPDAHSDFGPTMTMVGDTLYVAWSQTACDPDAGSCGTPTDGGAPTSSGSLHVIPFTWSPTFGWQDEITPPVALQDDYANDSPFQFEDLAAIEYRGRLHLVARAADGQRLVYLSYCPDDTSCAYHFDDDPNIVKHAMRWTQANVVQTVSGLDGFSLRQTAVDREAQASGTATVAGMETVYVANGAAPTTLFKRSE